MQFVISGCAFEKLPKFLFSTGKSVDDKKLARSITQQTVSNYLSFCLAPTDRLYLLHNKRRHHQCDLHANQIALQTSFEFQYFLHFRSTERSSVGMLITQCPQYANDTACHSFDILLQKKFSNLKIPSPEPVPILLIISLCPFIMQWPCQATSSVDMKTPICFVSF